MRSALRHDPDSGELRLVFTDLWNGQHERTEYRVVNDDGRLVRRRDDLDGLPAHRDPAGGWYIKIGPSHSQRDIKLRTEHQAVTATIKTPCRRLASKSGRAKCALCQPG